MKLTWNPPAIPRQIVARYTYTADYASEVHEGAYYLNGVRGVARPWTEVAIARNDLPLLLKSAFLSGSVRAAFLFVVTQMAAEFSDVLDNYDWGISSENKKQYRPGMPTWQTITDSGQLRDSLEVSIHE
jgi:hypothetical protein